MSDAANTGLISDCEALLEARDTLAGTATLNWSNSTSIAQWDGITLRGTPERVTRLDLRDAGLDGSVPAALGRLSELTYLNLRTNDLAGSLPSELGDLTGLTYINFHSNMLTGPIPDLSDLTGLEELYLPNNRLRGPVPSWLNDLTALRELWLWGNELSGTIPDLSALASLDKLKLAANNLTGGVPEASSLPSNLRWLIIQENPLGGTMPDLSTLTRMTAFWLHTNGLTGQIPASHFPTSVTSLNLRGNQFSGTIPDLSDLDKLQWLRLQNNRLSGMIPSTLGDMDSLTRLWLHGNMLSGSIPADLGDLTKLEILWLSDNDLSGDIPEELGDLGYLVEWRLAGNSLTGCVPTGLAAVSDNDLVRLGLEICEGLPDLEMETPSVDDASPEPGATFTLSATVTNVGDEESEATTLRYYQSTDDAITTSDTEVGTASVGALTAEGTGDHSIGLTAPSAHGAYYYGACVDEVTDESDTTNNCSESVQVDVGDSTATLPDLEVGTPSVDDASPEPGATFTLSATVTNAGDGESAATTLRYYRSTDATISDSDAEVGTDAVGALAAAGTSDQSIDLTTPSTDGTYYYGACVDAVTDESDTMNNCSISVVVDVEDSTPKPDLEVGTPSVNDASPSTGARFTLSATVTNTGDVASAATTLRYYRSTDATITTSDTQVGTDAVGAVASAGTNAESISLTAPSTAGTYYYGACVDTVTDESDTANNCSASVKVDVEDSTNQRTTRPNLEVGAPTVYGTTLGPEAPFNMYMTVTNSGDGASAATTLRYYRSTDATITTSDTQVGTDPVGSLAADGASDQSISLTAPSTMATYYYGACVGAVSRESDTTDNCSSSVEITMAPPDLRFDGGGKLGPALSTDGLFRLVVVVENDGRGKSAPTTMRIYRSTDTTITTSDIEIETHELKAVRYKEEGVVRSTWLAPPSALGYYFYGACWDAVPGESNTDNNCSTYFTAAVRPNLEVQEVKVSETSLETGESFTLTVKVKNTGLWEAPGTTLRFYRRAGGPGNILRSGTELGTDTVGSLASGGESEHSINLTAPSRHGTQYYGACVDPVPHENINVPNNCSQGAALAVVSQPDLTVSLTVNDAEVRPYARLTLSATVTNEGEADAGQTRVRYYRSADASISTSDSELGTDIISALSPAGTDEESISQIAPSSRTLLTYYYGACVDALTYESDTTNNCSEAVKVTVIVRPDLSLSTIAMTWRIPLVPGGTFSLSARIENKGDGESAATTVRFYHSADDTITTSDTEVGTVALEALTVGTIVHRRVVDLTAPSEAGSYYYGACVDAVAYETSTSNNCTSASTLDIPEPAPDLVAWVESTTDSSPDPGESFTLSAFVWNRGALSAGASTLRYYRSTSFWTLDPSTDTAVGTDSVGALASTAESEESIDLTAPAIPDNYYYYACVDSVTDEDNTDNNCQYFHPVRVTVTAPNLQVGTPTVDDASPDTGGTFTLSATVKNAGTEGAAATTLRYYRSTDATITTSDTAVGTDSVGALAAAGTSAQSVDLTAPSTKGTYYYGACVDSVTDESPTTDNCSSSVKVEVGLYPDLEVGAPSVDNATLATGAAFTLSATVTNAGDGGSPATTLRWYRSTDSTITSADTEVGTDDVGALAAAGTSDQTIDLTAPSTAGAYYYGACVDSVTDESDTTDNCSVSVTVVVE